MKTTKNSFSMTRYWPHLEFTLRYGGVSNDEMLRRVATADCHIDDSVRRVVGCFTYEPEEKEVHILAPFLHEWFDKNPTTDEIYLEAKKQGLREPHPSVALHLAAVYLERTESEHIRIGHPPITIVHRKAPVLLAIGCGSTGRYLSTDSADCAGAGGLWRCGSRFAFERPAPN